MSGMITVNIDFYVFCTIMLTKMRIGKHPKFFHAKVVDLFIRNQRYMYIFIKYINV